MCSRRPAKRKANKLFTAHVGATRPFTEADETRSLFANIAVLRHDQNFIKKQQQDIINLMYKRDFLLEDRTYDYVVLHSIFEHNFTGSEDFPVDAKVSPRHTVENWRNRLANTDAEFIVICEGQPQTLSGWQIDKIPGYKILERDTKITLYRREHD